MAGHEMDSAAAGDTLVPDHDVCAAGMQECAPGNGAYPVSFNLGWHGGVHLIAPRNAQGNAERVRAIADGTVVYVRKTAAAGVAALSYRGVRTDDGCVVIKHTTEIGEGNTAKVTFFSIYMHLQTVQALVVGKKIYRKDELGVAGSIYGQRGQIHFEIVCDDANLKNLVGRTSGPLSAGSGRKDAIYGDIWFKVPKGNPSQPGRMVGKLFINEPHPYRRDDSDTPPGPSIQMQAAQFTERDYIIRMRYEKGNCALTTFQRLDDGRYEEVGTQHAASGYEYDLYKEAVRLSGKYGDLGLNAALIPSASAIYEVLRLGRALGPDLLPENAKFGHWRKVAMPQGPRWINLNLPEIGVYSDADFPHWADWTLIHDDETTDTLCDSPTIRKWLDLNQDNNVTHAEAVAALNVAVIRERMSKVICKFPSEWSSTDIEQRWGWVKQSHDALPVPLSSDDFVKLKDHIEALVFWEQAKSADSSLPNWDGCWHLPPRAFIEHFRKCGWRSLREISQTLPRHSSAGAGGNITWATAEARWSELNASNGTMPAEMHLAVSRMWRKYGFSNAQRQAHFLAQILKETGALVATVEAGSLRYFRTMYEVLTPQEAAADFDHNHTWLFNMNFLKGRGRDAYVAQRPGEIQQKATALGNIQPGDGSRFRGRGLIHLTGRKSYEKYGVFRRMDFSVGLNPERLSNDAIAVVDSACYFWVRATMQSPDTGALRSGMNINRRADVGVGDDNVAAITTPVNGGSNGVSERKEFFRHVYFLLNDQSNAPVGFARQIEDQ
jgi:hydroxyethylthiazole kinase